MAVTFTPAGIEEGYREGLKTGIWEQVITFVDDNPVAGVTDEVLGTYSGMLRSVRILFGTPAPDTFTVTVKDSTGNVLVTDASVTASGSLTIDTPIPFVGGLTLSLEDNTTADAEATVSILFTER